MSTIKLDVYFFFPGNCREAMEYYKTIFGGELSMQTYDEAPAMEGTPENAAGKIMHAALSGGDVSFMASDSTTKDEYAESFISISLTGSDEEKLRGLFDKLSEGGKVEQPLEPVFWGGLFGTVKDKFGVDWMVSIDAPKE